MHNMAAPAETAASVVNNLLEIGTQSLPLRYFLAQTTRGTRRLLVDPVGPYARIKIEVPGAAQGVLPPDVTFAELNTAGLAMLEGLAADCQPARLLVLHAAEQLSLARRLAAVFDPDVIIWPHNTALPQGFLVDPQPPNAPALGLEKHWLLASPGFHTLRNALLVRADAAQRRHRQARPVVYGVQDVVLAGGAWPPEGDQHSIWAWTGPQRTTTILLPPPTAGPAARHFVLLRRQNADQ